MRADNRRGQLPGSAGRVATRRDARQCRDRTVVALGARRPVPVWLAGCGVVRLRGGERRARGSRGSVLALVPAVFLVLILFGALTVDSAVVYLGQRQLHDALLAAANDSVGAAVDDGAFYQQGRIVLDPTKVAVVACASVLAQHMSDVHGLKLWVSTGGRSVRLQATADVDAVFGRVIPGFGQRSVHAVAVATLADGPGAQGVPSDLLNAPLRSARCS